MAVLLSDESMGTLLLSSLHYSIWVGRTDEDAAQERAKLAKHIWWKKKTKKKLSKRRAEQTKANFETCLQYFGDHQRRRLRTNLDCNTAIYCCCADDACKYSCVAEVLPDS